MSGPSANPAIESAIAAVEEPSFQMTQVQIPLPSGRPFIVALPIDVTDLEALQAVGALLMAVDRIRTQAPRSIIVPKGVIIK